MARTTLLLLLCFILAQADKQVIGLIALPVQESFGLSNTQLGFLQGGAFAIAFAIGGLPISRLIDTGHRIRLAAICVALWSIATILCGLATSFAMLLIFRAATAVAEAGLPPAAFSIFSQQEDSRRVARATGIFMLAPFAGAGLMFAGGGWLLNAAQNGAWGSMEPWRIVFIVVGVPGLLLAPLLAFAGREPPRERSDRVSAGNYREVFRHIFVGSPFLRYYYLALCSVYLAIASLLAWYPSLLVRQAGVDTGAAGIGAGLTYLAGGVTGTLAATFYFSSRQTLTPATLVRAFRGIAVVLAPVLISLPWFSELWLSLAGYGLFAFLTAGVIALMPVPMQLSLDGQMRARGAAILSLLMSALAGTLGPLSVGVIMDVAGQSLAAALCAVMLAASALAILFFSAAVRQAAIRP